MSVPITWDERVLACLGVRFAASAVPQQTAVERFLPRLRQCAAKISLSFSEQQRKGTPQAAD